MERLNRVRRLSGSSFGSFWVEQSALLVLVGFLVSRMISTSMRICCQIDSCCCWQGGNPTERTWGSSEQLPGGQRTRIRDNRAGTKTPNTLKEGARADATAPASTSVSASSKAPQTGRSCHYHCQLLKWFLCCPCLFTWLGTDPKSTVVALGPILQCRGCWQSEYSALSASNNGWLTLPHEVEDSPNIGKRLRGQMHDRCPLPPLSWPLYACHQLSLARDVGNPKCIYIKKRFYRFCEIEEGNSTRGS